MARQSGTLSTLVPTLRTMVAESAISENWLAPFGVALVEAGAVDEAMVVFDSLPEPQLDFFWLATTQVVAELAVGLDRQDAIPVLFERLAPHRHLLGISASGSMVVGLVATTLGMLALAAGHHDSAVDLLEEAVARADEIEAPFEAVRARRLLATALMGLGDRTAGPARWSPRRCQPAAAGRFEGELPSLRWARRRAPA